MLFDFDFAYLVLNNEKFWIRGGSAQPFVKFPPSLVRHFALPPLAEQKRIVAKVDVLMALCDRLDAQQQERTTRHAALARASLACFADAPTPANLNSLFHPSHAIAPADFRKTILTLAVQGKLVPQDPKDEPATQQLAAIQARKDELVCKNQIKKGTPSRSIDPSEVDHDIPVSWVWVRLVDVCELITDGTHQTPKYTAPGRIFLSAQNVKPFRFMPAKHRFVSEEDYQGYIKNRKTEKGDVLLTRVGAGIGEAATVDQDLDFAIYVSLGLVRPVRGFVFSDYITLWLNSPDGTEKSSRNTYGKGVSQGNLNLSLIRNFLVPLPPLAEQRRIVAKVDQLMALVDQLESQLVASRASATNLMEAVVAELTAQE
jgi:type I restriction enzyme S subunit